MYNISKHIKTHTESPVIIGIDFEWTKNYKIKKGNKPFCFSYIYFNAFNKDNYNKNDLTFGVELFYIEKETEMPELVNQANKKLLELSSIDNSIIIGHQLHSDLGVVSDHSNENDYIHQFKKLWKDRRNNNIGFDTRYDITNLDCQSRRLVDVCKEYELNVTQPEIKGSMSKMHLDFIKDHKKSFMEKLSIMNIRHSLSCAIMYNMYKADMKGTKIYTNDIIYKNIKELFAYTQDNNFKELLIKRKNAYNKR